jgi:hypothetical protein
MRHSPVEWVDDDVVKTVVVAVLEVAVDAGVTTDVVINGFAVELVIPGVGIDIFSSVPSSSTSSASVRVLSASDASSSSDAIDTSIDDPRERESRSGKSCVGGAVLR